MRELETGVFVSGQIGVEEVPALAAQGICTIVNNRPDGEAPGQPEGEAIRAAADEAGVDYVSLPVAQLSGEGVAEMRRILESAERPILAFCAAGTRSTYLWALARAGTMDAGDIEEIAQAAGHDLTPIRRFL